MARRRDNPERGRLTQSVEQHHAGMKEKGEQIEDTTGDSETERQTLDQLEGGTQEGIDEVTQGIETAQEVSSQEFAEQTQELEQIHSDTEKYEAEMREHAETVSSDVDKVSEASARVHSESARRKLDAAREAGEHDIEFLDDCERRAQAARTESEQLQDDHRRRVDAARGS